ncbi:MAG TPA: VOC family protein [Spirochaetota bacterium]|jgi:predicted enzyme related to lactoylglutathione lyase|nr:VOC family protein [Spirochaetota bacterium]HOH37394.1 VOC family protein [Spirochaetota bacterium]HQA52778.1 VOC family protein [Spirochaetota bacterium]
MKILKTMSRIFIEDKLDETISFYEGLYGESCSLKFEYPELELKLASIGNILIICGSREKLKPFTETKTAFRVDSIKEYEKYLTQCGCEILSAIKKVPTGFNMIVRHNDGAIFEYVEFVK